MRSKILGFTLSLTLILVFKSVGQIYHMENGHARFFAEATLNSYTGFSNKLQGVVDFKSNRLNFRIPVKTIDTGVSKRNRDMHKLINADQHPYVEFIGSFVNVPDINSEAAQKVIVEGQFELNGIKKPLTVEGILQKDKEGFTLNADWEMNISDYGIKPPRFLVNEVRDKHKIEINGLIKESKTISFSSRI